MLRVGYVAFAKTNQPIQGDQLFYNAEANRLARGDGFLEPFDPQALSRGVIREGKDPAADHPPLTVIVLAPVSFVTSEALIPQRLTMAVLGTVAVVIIGLLARRLAGDRAAWIAAGIAAIYPNLWVNDGLIMSETIATLVVALALLYAYRLIREPNVWNALIVGALCGLAALTRAELVLLVPLLAVPAALVARSVATAQRWKLAGVGVLAAAVLIGPWVGYNLSRFDEPTYSVDERRHRVARLELRLRLLRQRHRAHRPEVPRPEPARRPVGRQQDLPGPRVRLHPGPQAACRARGVRARRTRRGACSARGTWSATTRARDGRAGSRPSA